MKECKVKNAEGRKDGVGKKREEEEEEEDEGVLYRRIALFPAYTGAIPKTKAALIPVETSLI